MARSNTASIIKIILTVIVVIIVIGYAIFNSRLFIKGPQINIDSPVDGAVIIDNPLIKLTGKALNISHLELNGRQIYTEENDSFSESLLLNSGYNIIQVIAEDKFGRSVKQTLQLVYRGEEEKIIYPASEELELIESEEATSSDLENI